MTFEAGTRKFRAIVATTMGVGGCGRKIVSGEDSFFLYDTWIPNWFDAADGGGAGDEGGRGVV